MDSAAHGHHLSSSSSSTSSSPCYGLDTSSHAWTATNYSILDTNGFHCIQPSMAQDLSFQWLDTHMFHEHPMNRIQLPPPNQTLLPDTYYFNHGITAEAPCSFDSMSSEALDLLPCPRFSRIFDPDSSQIQIGITGDGFNYIPPSLSTSYKLYPLKVSASSNGGDGDMKKSNTFKKPRLENRSHCTPLKVRKEKLGDRIAALQQLVAPFGKTDTASVLMEAIGYIKFLQNQVETLSVPYVRASRVKTTRPIKHDGESEETKRDLKSRGLCLVPLSCLSYIDDCGAAAVWPPAYYGGA